MTKQSILNELFELDIRYIRIYEQSIQVNFAYRIFITYAYPAVRNVQHDRFIVSEAG